MKRKRKTKKRRPSLAQILKRKDVRSVIRNAETNGYSRGWAACKNNPDV